MQFDFGNLESPLSGSNFINANLEPWRDALHSLHKGPSTPSYAVAGMMWIDDSGSPWVLNIFDGTDNISVGTVDPTTNAFTPSGVSQAAADISVDNSGFTVFGGDDVQEVFGEVDAFADSLGTAAFEDASTFATAAQGTKADETDTLLKSGSAGQILKSPGGSASPVWSNFWDFISSQQSYTNGGTVTVAHGLGAVPSDISAYLVCTTAQSAYSVGDIIPLNYGVSTFNGPGNWVGVVMLKANTTNIVLEVSNNGFLYQTTALTAGNFRIVLKARK